MPPKYAFVCLCITPPQPKFKLFCLNWLYGLLDILQIYHAHQVSFYTVLSRYML